MWIVLFCREDRLSDRDSRAGWLQHAGVGSGGWDCFRVVWWGLPGVRWSCGCSGGRARVQGFRFRSCWWSDLVEVRDPWPDLPVAVLGWLDGFWLCLGRVVHWWLHIRRAATVGIQVQRHSRAGRGQTWLCPWWPVRASAGGAGVGGRVYGDFEPFGALLVAVRSR